MKDYPKFEITLVLDGKRYGFLITKKCRDGRNVRTYFFLDNNTGLRPPDQILKRHDIAWVSVKDQIFYRKLFREIKACAEAAHESTKPLDVFNLTNKYDDLKGGFGSYVGRMFEQDRCNKEVALFFENRNVFYDGIMNPVRKKDQVLITAESLSVVSYNNIFPEDNQNAGYSTDISYYQSYLKMIEQFQLKDFKGRQFVFDNIDKLIQTPSFTSGYIFIRGEPGIGKSAILAEFINQKKYSTVYHFNMATISLNTTWQFLGNICSQLIQKFNLPHITLQSNFHESGAFLNHLLFEISPQLDKNNPLVIAIDALDEVKDGYKPSAQNLLFLPTDLPQHVYILATARTGVNLQLKGEIKEISLVANKDDNLHDAAEYISSRINEIDIQKQIKDRDYSAERFASELLVNSGGNFMYLRSVFDALKESELSLDEIKTLPKGLMGYYRLHWAKMRQNRPDFDNEVKLLICLIGAAQTYISLDKIARWTNMDECRIRSPIGQWREFIRQAGDEVNPSFRLYHASFADYLCTEVDPGLKYYHGLIAKAILNEKDRSCGTSNPYSRIDNQDITGLVHHLIHADNHALKMEAETLLFDWRFLQERINRGQVYDLIRDMQQVQSALEDKPRIPLLRVLEQAIRFNAIFLLGYPEELFSCLWNSCWWYDCPQAGDHYNIQDIETQHTMPWNRPGEKIYPWLESWRKEFETISKLPWLCSLSPPVRPLGGPLKHVFRGHGHSISSLAVSPCENMLASGSYDTHVNIWDTASGTIIHQLCGHNKVVKSCAFSENGDQLISVSEDSFVIIWSAATGEKLFEKQIKSGLKIDHVHICIRLNRIYCVDETCGFIIYDYKENKILDHQFNGANRCDLLSVTSDGTFIASTFRSDFKSLCFLDLKTGKGQTLSLEYSTRFVRLSSDGKLAAIVNATNNVYIIDLKSQKRIHLKNAPNGDRITKVVFSKDNRFLASTNHGSTLRIWDTATGCQTHCFRSTDYDICETVFNHDASEIISGSLNGCVQRWDLHAGDEYRCLNRLNQIFEMVITPDHNILAFGSQEGTVGFLEINTGFVQFNHHAHRAVHSLAIIPDSSKLLSGGIDGEVKVWDLATKREIRVFNKHKQTVTALDVSPCGKFAVSGGPDELDCSRPSIVYLWKIDTGEILGTYRNDDGNVWGVRFSPDGSCFALRLSQGKVGIWRPEMKELFYVACDDASNSIREMKFSPDGRCLALQYDKEGRCVIHDLERQKEIFQIGDSVQNVAEVTFLPETTHLLVRVNKEYIQKWDYSTGEMVDEMPEQCNFSSYLAFCESFPYKAIEKDDQTVIVNRRNQLVTRIPEFLKDLQVLPEKNIILGRHYNRISLYKLEI